MAPVPAERTVSVVIPVFDRLDLTLACLAALARATDEVGLGIAVQVIVVDNGSTDGTADRLAAEHPHVLVLRNEHNQGFARGCNQGVAAAAGDIVVLLNNDTEVQQGWLAPLLAVLDDDPAVALVAPKLLFPDGRLQHAGMVLIDDRARGVPLNGLHLWYRQPADLPAANVRRDRRTLTGAVLAMRRSAFEAVGGFDEGYWNGCEDVDLCLALAEAGWRSVYEPSSVVVHHESASGPQRWTRLNENLRRLAEKWSGRARADLVVLADGTTVPLAGVPAASVGSERLGAAASPVPLPQLRIEGSLFGLHSLAQVNRELGVRLAASGAFEVSANHGELPELTAADDERLVPVVATTLRPDTVPSVVLRQAWPPRFVAPADRSTGRDAPLVMIQPWEYGGLPEPWIAPLRELADEIWCYTSWLRDCYVRSGIPADKVRVVPIGVDTERFRPDGPTFPLRTTKQRRLLFVGGAVHRKGIDLLIRAYRESFGRDDDVCLVVKTFGGTTFYRGNNLDEQLRRLAADPAGPELELIEDDLTQDEMAALYRSCHVLVHPYRGEGFGMPIAEAMASGLAVVVTADGAAMDFCDDTTAYLVPARRVPCLPGSVSLPPSAAGYWLAEADLAVLGLQMRRAVDDVAGARALGAAGRERVRRQLDWDAITATVADRLRCLVGATAVRNDPDAPFGHGLEPIELDGARARTILVPVGPSWNGWQRRLAELARTIGAFGEDAPVTIVVHVDVEETAREATIAELVEVLDAGSAEDSGPDVLAIVDRTDPWAAARLYRSVDAVLTGRDPRLRRRTEAVGRLVVTAADDPALAGLINDRSPATARAA